MSEKKKKNMRARKLIDLPEDGADLWIKARQQALEEKVTVSDWIFNLIRSTVSSDKPKKK